MESAAARMLCVMGATGQSRTLAILSLISYIRVMITVRRTEHFDQWLKGLRDSKARSKILVRLDRLKLGNPGMLSLLATASVRCVSTMDLGIAFISSAAARS